MTNGVQSCYIGSCSNVCNSSILGGNSSFLSDNSSICGGKSIICSGKRNT